MQIIAEQKNTRQTSRKVRLVANAVRKLSVKEAFNQLAVMERKASIVVAKVLRQAVANALHNHRLTADQIEIENILVNEGPTYKRFRAVSRGRAHNIFKRTSHVRVVLKTKEAQPVEAPVVAKEKKEAKAEPKKLETKEPKKVVKKAKK